MNVQDPCFDLCFVEIKPKRFVWCRNKVGRKYIQEQQPNEFYCYNLYRINKDEGEGDDESLPLQAFRRDIAYAIFLKYSKERRLSSGHAGIRNIPSDICYDDTKYYQV